MMFMAALGWLFVAIISGSARLASSGLAASTETIPDLFIDDSAACDPKSQPLVVVQRNIGVIVSPGFNRIDYEPKDVNCSWVIVAPTGHKVLVDFNRLRLGNNELSSLEFYDGPNRKGELLESFRGIIPIKHQFLTPRNVVHVRFQASMAGSVVVPEFAFWTTFISPPKKCDLEMGEKSCKHNMKLGHKINLKTKCYLPDKECDGVDDCGDGTDEENCPPRAETFPQGCGKTEVEPIRMNHGPRIKGGSKARHGSWPWQVSVRLILGEPSGHVCGAALINEQWILTTAHCFNEMPSLSDPMHWSIHLGRYNKIVFDDENDVIRYPEEIHYHPNWTGIPPIQVEPLKFDIVLVKLNAPVPLDNKFVRPICLPSPDLQFSEGESSYVTGWGEVQGTGFELVLKQANLPIISNRVCQTLYPKAPIHESMLCAGFPDGGHDACQGDSGGPLVVYNMQSRRWELAGIVATGPLLSCGISGQPGIYMRTSYFVTWIEETIAADALT